MLINVKKTKNIIFNFTDNFKFATRLNLKGEMVETIENTKLLGTIISNDLKWDLNTANIVKKANSRMELLRKVSSFGAPVQDLITIYILFIRSLLEQSATVWHSSLSQENSNDLERVQKSAIKIILKDKYKGYKKSLAHLGLDNLNTRRKQLCLDFAKKCENHTKLTHMFPKNHKEHNMNTRFKEMYAVQHAKTSRLQKSPLIYMQKLLNEDTHKTFKDTHE